MTKITHFKREWLTGCKIIDREMSKVELVVAHPVTEKNRIKATEPGKSDKYIVNLKAVPKDKLDKLKALFAGGVQEVPIEEVRDIFLTASIWVDNDAVNPLLPMKGEKVICSIGYVPNREKDALLLRVVQLTQQPVTQLEEVEWSSIFDDAPSTVEDAIAEPSHEDELVHNKN